jgi:hypothetical protein
MHTNLFNGRFLSIITTTVAVCCQCRHERLARPGIREQLADIAVCAE